MFKNIFEKLKESFISIFPIVALVAVLGFTLTPLSGYDIGKFLVSAVLLILGMALFTVGADNAMFAMGSSVGGNLSKSRKLFTLLIFAFLLGIPLMFIFSS